MVDILKWKFKKKREEQTYKEQGVEEMMYSTASAYFGSKLVEEFGIEIIKKYLDRLGEIKLSPEKSDREQPIDVLKEVCVKDITEYFVVDYKELKSYLNQ